MAEASKRAHDPPTGHTPGKKQPKRRSASGKFSKRSLFSSAESNENDVALEKDQKVSNAIMRYHSLICIKYAYINLVNIYSSGKCSCMV